MAFRINTPVASLQSAIHVSANYPFFRFFIYYKATDTTINDIVNGINASMPTRHIIDGSGNTVAAKMGNLVNNNDGTLTLTAYVTKFASTNALNNTNIGNGGSFSDTFVSMEYTSYLGSPHSLQNSMYIQDQSTLIAAVTTTIPFSAEVPYVAPQQQIVKYAITGSVEPGDSYTLGGITYTVQPSDTSLSDIADKLVLGLNGSSLGGVTGSPLSGITASKELNGDIVLTADVSGVPFTIPSSSAANFSPNDQSIVKLPQSFNQYSEIGGLVTVGKLKLSEAATGKEIVVEGNGLEYIGMDTAGIPDRWIKNLMDINSMDAYSTAEDILQQPIQESIDICESALIQLNTIRSDIGSFQNQLESTMASISVTRIMTIASESQIRDVDFAAESAEFNKRNLLVQAGNFALTQANADLKRVMSLLQ